jgi:hypothetical protein
MTLLLKGLLLISFGFLLNITSLDRLTMTTQSNHPPHLAFFIFNIIYTIMHYIFTCLCKIQSPQHFILLILFAKQRAVNYSTALFP